MGNSCSNHGAGRAQGQNRSTNMNLPPLALNRSIPFYRLPHTRKGVSIYAILFTRMSFF